MPVMSSHPHPGHPVLALVQPADQPPELMVETARAAEAAGLEEMWLWEDCFAASAIAPTGAVLAATDRLRVGIGLLPVPLRAPSLTAMEIATLARMFPGRVLPGLGHGIQDWMAQAGVRVGSPLTLLREHLGAVRALLAGEEVSTEGRYVVLDRVALRFPPALVPPVLVGGRGPKTLALAGSLADGVILDDVAPGGTADPERVAAALDVVAAARRDVGRDGPPEVVAFLATRADLDAEHLQDQIGALGRAGVTRVAVIGGGVDGPPGTGDRVLELAEVLGRLAR